MFILSSIELRMFVNLQERILGITIDTFTAQYIELGSKITRRGLI
jgi:hypothetical protein